MSHHAHHPSVSVSMSRNGNPSRLFWDAFGIILEGNKKEPIAIVPVRGSRRRRAPPVIVQLLRLVLAMTELMTCTTRLL